MERISPHAMMYAIREDNSEDAQWLVDAPLLGGLMFLSWESATQLVSATQCQLVVFKSRTSAQQFVRDNSAFLNEECVIVPIP